MKSETYSVYNGFFDFDQNTIQLLRFGAAKFYSSNYLIHFLKLSTTVVLLYTDSTLNVAYFSNNFVDFLA